MNAIVESSVTSIAPMQLLERAVEKGADPDQLSKLMDLQDRWEAKQAQRAFFAALALFQEKCPKIERTAKGHNTKYAKLDAIIEAIRPLMRECELTYRWETNPKADGWVEVTCIITHATGHSERTSTLLPPDESGGKNAIQGVGSTNSYGFRYSLIGALGIATADEDKDGGKPAVSVDDLLAYNQTVRDNWQSIAEIKEALALGEWERAAEAVAEIRPQSSEPTDSVFDRLWKAPTKGGIWTTEERKLLGSDEFIAAMRALNAA